MAGEELAALQETIVKKDGEMAAMEERYKKYLTKAKSVIKTLDPKYNPSFNTDHAALRQQLVEKDKQIDNLEVLQWALGCNVKRLLVGTKRIKSWLSAFCVHVYWRDCII